jgi:hypothetical protein
MSPHEYEILPVEVACYGLGVNSYTQRPAVAFTTKSVGVCK